MFCVQGCAEKNWLPVTIYEPNHISKNNTELHWEYKVLQTTKQDTNVQSISEQCLETKQKAEANSGAKPQFIWWRLCIDYVLPGTLFLQMLPGLAWSFHLVTSQMIAFRKVFPTSPPALTKNMGLHVAPGYFLSHCYFTFTVTHINN